MRVSLQGLLLFLQVFKWQIASAGLSLVSIYYKLSKRKRALVGKLIEKDLGQYGNVSIEVKDGGTAEVKINLELVDLARFLASKTQNFKWDDKVVELIASAVGAKKEEAAPETVETTVAPQPKQAPARA